MIHEKLKFFIWNPRFMYQGRSVAQNACSNYSKDHAEELNRDAQKGGAQVNN